MIRQCLIYPFSILLLPALLSVLPAGAQNNTLYFMHPVPQAIHTNPALFYQCRTYIELPVLSTIRYSYSNSGFSYHDAIHYGTGSRADSLVIDLENLDRKLKKNNYVRSDVTVNLAGAGFQLDAYYLHFNISNFTESRGGIPGDLLAVRDGNWDIESGQPRDLDLSGIGVKATNYFQIAAGVSTEIMDGLYAGVRLKYLRGSASITSPRTDLYLLTEGDPIRLEAQTNYRLRASFPVDVSLDPQGYVSELNFSNSFNSILQDFILANNHGLAVDLGAIYRYDDRLTLAASLIDLGFIRWKSNVNRFETSGSIYYSGFDLRQYANNQGNSDFLESLIDSISQSFQFETSQKPYFTSLTTKLYAGAMYQVDEKLNVSALARTEFFDLRPHFSLTLAANYSPFPFLHGTISYSIMNNRFDQMGLGIAVGNGPIQFYIVSDHIPIHYVRDSSTGLIWPYSAQTMNFRLGMNLIFGCSERDRGVRPPVNRKKWKSKKSCPAYD
jgi:hypothetical protein